MTKNRIELSTFQAKAKKIQGATPTNRRLNSYFVHVGNIKHKKSHIGPFGCIAVKEQYY